MLYYCCIKTVCILGVGETVVFVLIAKYFLLLLY